MLKPIDTSKYTPAALRTMGYLPVKTTILGSGWIAAINTQSETPFVVELENGALFKLGGLTESQTEQLPIMLGDLIGGRITFKFAGEFNDLDQPVDAVFNTLLPNANKAAIQ